MFSPTQVTCPPVCPPVGGMPIPIDTTAVFIAGVQSITLWMLPALAAAGVTAYFVIARLNKAN